MDTLIYVHVNNYQLIVYMRHPAAVQYLSVLLYLHCLGLVSTLVITLWSQHDKQFPCLLLLLRSVPVYVVQCFLFIQFVPLVLVYCGTHCLVVTGLNYLAQVRWLGYCKSAEVTEG